MSEHTASPDGRIRVYILGTLHLERRMGDGRWEDVPTTSEEWGIGHPTRSFLRYLLAHGRCVGRSTILETLWTDVDSADRYLYNAASTLRRILRSDEQTPLLETIYNRTTYKLADQSHVWVDVDHCTALLQDVKRIGPTSERGLRLLQEAELLFRRGPLFADEPGDWCFGLREQTKTMQYRCQLWLAEAYEAHQQLAEAEIVVEALLTQDPTDERALRQLMTLLHKQGLTSEAVRRYRQTASFLKQKSLTLSAETEAHVQAIQRGSGVQGFSSPSPTFAQIPPPSAFIQDSQPRWQSGIDLAALVPTSLNASSEVLSIVVEPFRSRELLGAPFLELQQKLSQGANTLNVSQKSDEGVQLSRRHALLAIATVALPLLTLSQRQLSPLDMEELLWSLKTSIDACWHLSKEFDIIAVYSVIATYLPPLTAIVKHIPSHRKAAAHLAAQVFLLKAIIGRHVAGLQAAETACQEAVFYSTIAEEPVLHLASLRHLAMIYYYAKRHKEELALYHHMQPLLSQEAISPLVRSFVYAGWAGTQALNGLSQEAHASLALARDFFFLQPATEPSPLYIDYDVSQLFMSEGLTYCDLGAYEKAFEAFLHVDGLSPKVPVAERGRLEFLNCQALTVLRLPNRDREMQQCIDYWTAGIQGAITLQSRQRYEEACHVYTCMEFVWPSEKKIKALRALMIA